MYCNILMRFLYVPLDHGCEAFKLSSVVSNLDFSCSLLATPTFQRTARDILSFALSSLVISSKVVHVVPCSIQCCTYFMYNVLCSVTGQYFKKILYMMCAVENH